MTPDEGFLKPSFAALLDAYVREACDPDVSIESERRCEAAFRAVLAAHAEVVEALEPLAATECSVRPDPDDADEYELTVTVGQVRAARRALSVGGTR